jgi:ribosomal protein L33
MSIANDQILLCESVGCIECSECIGAFYSKYGNSPKTPQKTKIIETKVQATKFDDLSKKVVNRSYKDSNSHSLYEYALEKFTK